MLRLPILSTRFQARRKALGLTSGPAKFALAATIANIARGPLPGPQDVETLMPPISRYWFRRVPGHNLWVYFAFDETQLVIANVTARPPVPLID